MKYVNVVKSFFIRNTLYSSAMGIQLIALMVSDNLGEIVHWIAVFMYVIAVLLMICPFHYKSYRMLYDIYSKFPTWLQPHPPSIPNYMRRTFKTNIPDGWSTVVLRERSIHEEYTSYSDWCEDNVIGRYYVGQRYINPDTAKFHSCKVYFEDGKDALMFRIANA